MQENRTTNSYFPRPQGMYNSINEHDACGVGLVADINAVRKHEIVENGIKVLERLMHRGAVGGDSQTGDGAGIMTQIPHDFFKAHIKNLPERGKYGVGMVFLPRDKNVAHYRGGRRSRKLKDFCMEGSPGKYGRHWRHGTRILPEN